jgi:hypothetical protein
MGASSGGHVRRVHQGFDFFCSSGESGGSANFHDLGFPEASTSSRTVTELGGRELRISKLFLRLGFF